MTWFHKTTRVIELGKKEGNDFAVIRRLSECLRKFNVAIVQSHNWATIVECELARRLSGTQFHVYSEHGGIFYNLELPPFKRRIRRWLQRWAMASASQVVTIADRTKAVLCREIDFPLEKVQVVPNGVELLPKDFCYETSRAEIRQRLKITEDFVIGAVGRLVEVKGFDILLRSCAELPSSLPWRLIVVGGGDQESQLRALANRLKIEQRVHWAGQQSNMHSWYAGMDLFVNSSHSEGMCLAILEAMSHSLPVIATDVGDNAILVGSGQEACGLVTPPGEVVALSKCIASLAANSELRGEYCRNANRRYLNEYNVDRMVRNYESLYDRLLTSERVGLKLRDGMGK